MKNESIIRAIGEIDEDIILEASIIHNEQNLRTERIAKKKVSHNARIALIAAVLVLSMGIMAGAVYVLHNWDTVFENYFQPTDKEKETVDSAIEDVDATVSLNGVTLTIRQTIGDDYNLYAVLDIKLPDAFDMSTLIIDPDAGLPKNEHVYTYDEATDTYYYVISPCTKFGRSDSDLYMPFVSFNQTVNGTEIHEGSVDDKIIEVDPVGNTITLLVKRTFTEKISGNPVTLSFEKLSYITDSIANGGVYVDVVNGPFSITWTPSYDCSSKAYTVYNGDTEIGSVILTPFYAAMLLDDASVLGSYRQVYDSIVPEQYLTITLTDGTIIEKQSTYGSIYRETVDSLAFEMDYWFELNKIIDLNEVASVEINGCTVKPAETAN